MHILELPTALRDELFTSAWGAITPRLTITAYALPVTSYNADGTANYATTYQPVTWDLTSRIDRRKQIALEFQKPYLPLDGQDNTIQASRIMVDLINTDEAVGTEQLGSILKGQGIEQASAVLSVDVNGQVFPVYRGKIYGRPQEKKGITTIEIRDEFWHIARKPVTYEKFDTNQETAIMSGSLNPVPAHVGDSLYYDGISVFSQNGTILTSVNNPAADQIRMLKIRVNNGAKLGKYEIYFTSQTTYRLTYPDNRIFIGNINGFLWSDYVNLFPDCFDLIGDPTEKKIEFFIYKSMTGNPVDLILNEIEKAYTEAYGTQPISPSALPINYASFALAKARFKFHEVFVSETNKDNTVWGNWPGKRPLNVLQLCQKIADHIGCQIVVDNYGFISLKQPGKMSDTMYTLSDSDAIISHEIIGNRADNYFKFQYGFNDGNGSYSSYIIKDERGNPNEEKFQRTILLPYFKSGISDAAAQDISERMMERILRGFSLLSLKLKPNYALMHRPGDRVRVVTNTQPRIASFWEVFESNVDIGGEGVLKLVKIPVNPKDDSVFCKAVLCADTYS